MRKFPTRLIFNLLLQIVLIICCFSASAQQISLDDFNVLRSYGTMPEDFLTSARKANAERSGIKISNHARGREKFEIAADYGINELMLSGRVVYGDPIGAYIGRVADSLLKPFPEVRSRLRFYVTKSDVPNAYSTDRGIIFINVGLIARLKNEAELAYVISHETVHYVKQHNIHIFLEKERIFSRKHKDNDYRELSFTDRLLAINFRSKEIETEADVEGLRTFYSRSPYDMGSVTDVFNILLYSAYPFTN
jgi:beta-barrel assembly-enhancing protease